MGAEYLNRFLWLPENVGQPSSLTMVMPAKRFSAHSKERLRKSSNSAVKVADS